MVKATKQNKHEDTNTSLHPRTFREALKELVDAPLQKKTKKAGGRAKDVSPPQTDPDP